MQINSKLFYLKKTKLRVWPVRRKGQLLQPFISPSNAVTFLWKTHALLWTGLLVLGISKVTSSFFSNINKHMLEVESGLSVSDDF